MDIHYRNARPGDGAILLRLFETSFCETFAHLYKEEDLNAFLGSSGIEDWERQLCDPAFACRIVEVDGAPAGYIKLGPLKLPVEHDGRALLLDQFYLLKEHHGVGIAQVLMDWGLEEAARRGARQLFLTVYIDNRRARRFYERYAFDEVGRYDFMVGNHADEDVILRKLL